MGNAQGSNHLRPIGQGIRSLLAAALCITLGFVVIEAVAGFAANSLALLADAAHNITDVFALGLSWFALRLQTRPSGSGNTYGYHRAGIMVALVNSVGLGVMSVVLLFEAFQRVREPLDVNAGALVSVGVLALIVNLGTALLIRKGGEHDLNLRSTFLHLVGDVASSGAAVVAGIAIFFTGARWLDPLMSGVISLLILRGAWGVFRETVDILMEATPRDVDMSALIDDVLSINGVLSLHDLHVWSVSKGMRTMSAHIQVEDSSPGSGDEIRGKIRRLLDRTYGISHSTLQLESSTCDDADLYCVMDSTPKVAAH